MDGKYQCESCSGKFDSQEALTQHSNAKHTQIKPSVIETKTMKRFALYSILSLIIIGLVYGIYSLVDASYTASATRTSFGLPNNPIHWHPELAVMIRGEEVAIPANIGIGPSYSNSPHYDAMMRMTNIHTHDASGKLHWEVMMRPPAPEDMYLDNFFQVWEKTFNKNCIFEYCNGPEGSVKMFVNDKPDYDFENYMVRDGDKIEILYQ